MTLVQILKTCEFCNGDLHKNDIITIFYDKKYKENFYIFKGVKKELCNNTKFIKINNMTLQEYANKQGV
jgi:hypothetical protein